ncbi:MAG: glycosyltransferase [Thermodesulfobacteriota bacterium]|nr:glycosyltransferase [Thermodesulfobacteriota bacterium]
MKSINIVIPCLKEAENLKFLIPQLIDNLNKSIDDFEIIIVDSVAPLDKTPEVCANFSKVKYINTESIDNYGNAVRTGIKNSTKEYVLFMDADGSHNPEIICEMIQKIEDRNICIASRYCDGGSTRDKVTSIFLSKLLNFVYSFVLGVKCSDWSGSFKLYKACFLKELTLNSNNFDIIPEILFKISRIDPKRTIDQVPYTFDTRIHGQTKRKLKTYIDFLTTLFKLRIS